MEYQRGRRVQDSGFWTWWPALGAGLLSLAVYARTLAPGLTWAHDGADGGDLLAAALTQGVPHPPGYPTYQLLLRAAIALFPGEPARAGNWLSAICAAAAVALLTDLARRALPARRWRGLIALAAALTWAFSPTLWGQAVITEVYSLNALFVVLLLWMLWRWREAMADGRSGRGWLIGASFIFGLGLGNHLSLALILPGAVVWLWDNRDLTPQPPSLSGKGEKARTGTRPISSRSASLPSAKASTPVSWRAVFREVLIALAAVALGLSVYAYLPWAAVGNPPVNWGDPRNLARLWWLVSGRLYRGLVFGVSSAYLPGRMAAWVADALYQFGPWGALIALAGLWHIDQHDHAWWRLTGLVGLAYSVYAIGYNTADSYVYLIPVWAVAALWLASGLDWGIQQARTWSSRRFTQYALRIILVLALLLLPGLSAFHFWQRIDLSQDHVAQDFVEGVLAEAEPNGVILTATDEPTFALWYALYGLGRRPDLTPVNVNLYVYPWYQETLATAHPFLVTVTGDPDLPLLGQLVADVAAQRPLYRTEPLNVIFKGFTEKPAGPLVRMSREPQ